MEMTSTVVLFLYCIYQLKDRKQRKHGKSKISLFSFVKSIFSNLSVVLSPPVLEYYTSRIKVIDFLMERCKKKKLIVHVDRIW